MKMAKARQHHVQVGELNPRVKRRAANDRAARFTFYVMAGIPILLVLIMFALLLGRSWPIISVTPLQELLGGRTWLPSQGLFGFFPFIMGTFWVTIVALILAVPPCLLTAIYLSEYAESKLRTIMKPMLDILAAIPSVVYGVWGVIAIVPIVKSAGPVFNDTAGIFPFLRSDNPTGYSIFAGGIVLAVMIAPLIIAITYEVFRTVPNGYREASLAVGATTWETIKNVVVPKTTSGIIAGIVLSASRALGETMAVLMVVGNVPKVPGSIFDPAYPLPALIANNYGEMMSIPLYESALMMAALVLLVIVLIFNILATLLLRQINGKVNI
jgi:phosphate transport system permease protein